MNLFQKKYIIGAFSLLVLMFLFLVARMFYNEARKPTENPTTSVQSNVPPASQFDNSVPNPKGY